jgi:hypothetical protein
MAFFGTKEVGPTVFDIPPGGAEALLTCFRMRSAGFRVQPRYSLTAGLEALACEATATKVCQSEKFPLRINGNFWHHEIG